jgi:hypothetical protein
MADRDRDPQSKFDADATTFKQLVGSLEKPSSHPTLTQFMKKLDQLPEIKIP